MKILRMAVLGVMFFLLLHIFRVAASEDRNVGDDILLGFKIVLELILGVWVLVLTYKLKKSGS